MANKDHIAGECVEQALADGVAFIEAASPLTRLHYFDGQYLRADAFALEQDYLRARDRLHNIAGGWGVVHGLGLSLAGDTLSVTPGLAITPAGNPVLAVGTLSADLAELVAVAAAVAPAGRDDFGDCVGEPPTGKITPALTIYEITVGPVQTLCGQEPVYGKLCDSACATDSRHPWWREGVALRLRPIGLQLANSPFAQGVTYLRNRVASAYFAAEPWLTPPALSGAGLASDLWCQPAGSYGRDEVPIGLLVREGGVTRMLDAWSARRERMDSQARGYWQGRMMMRPWNVFLAQVLQFQCQLAATFDAGGEIGPVDACADLRVVLERTRRELEALHRKYAAGADALLAGLAERPSKTAVGKLSEQLKGSWAELLEVSNALTKAGAGAGAVPKRRMLLLAGFADLPPAGYLPVTTSGVPVAEQLTRMFGEGVRLTFRAARADALPHLLEQARDMNRISLTRGLEDPNHPEDVEIFVPDGAVGDAATLAVGTWWRVDGDAPRAFDLLGMALAERRDTIATDTQSANLGEHAAVDMKMRHTAEPTAALSGLAHSGPRAGGGYAATLAMARERVEIETLLVANLQRVKDIARATIATHGADANAAPAQPAAAEPDVSARGLEALYLAGDVDADPFDLPVGAETACRLEARVAVARGDAIEAGIGAGFAGALTVIDRSRRASGYDEVQVEARLTGTITEYVPGAAPVTRADAPAPLRFALLRRGDRRDGVLVLDDRRFDPVTPAFQLDWGGAPMVLHLFALLAGATAGAGMRKAADGARVGMQFGIELAGQYRLARAEALGSAPAPVGGIGGAAVGTLSRLADLSDDAAFLARARRRLFPQLDQPALPVVKAVRDWVMFRQRRPQFCDPACVGVGDTGIDAFQVWHLCVDGDALERLTLALARNDAQALAEFPFQRVAVLRYQHESQQPEETPAHVRALWRLARPCARVVLARAWENDPGTGQGWQNHFRLRGMLDTIAALTQPPPQGGGAVATLPRAPAPLADGALDGGMLVVTTGAPAAARDALLVYGNWDRPNHYLTPDAPVSKLRFVADQPQGGELAAFIAGLSVDQPVLGVTLATTRAAPDAGASARLQAVVAALTAAGRPAPVASRQTVESLNAHDRKQLESIGQQPNDGDEVIFFERNAGA